MGLIGWCQLRYYFSIGQEMGVVPASGGKPSRSVLPGMARTCYDRWECGKDLVALLSKGAREGGTGLLPSRSSGFLWLLGFSLCFAWCGLLGLRPSLVDCDRGTYLYYEGVTSLLKGRRSRPYRTKTRRFGYVSHTCMGRLYFSSIMAWS
jgi:hypothetical protein